MRRFSKSLITLFITLVLALSGLAISPANAVDSVVDVDCGGNNFKVTTIGPDVEVSSGLWCTGDVVIPAGVTSIGYGAFFNAHDITSVTIPASVTSIQSTAFTNATGLVSVFFSDNSQLVYIGWGAFGGATKLNSITIPASVDNISTQAFRDATSLASITFAGTGLSPSLTIGHSVFRNTALTSIIIPARVTSIQSTAFTNATALTSITVESGNAFYTNSSPNDGVLFTKDLTTLHSYPAGKAETSYVIPSGVTQIGESAFAEVTALTSITIPAGVTYIGDGAFAYATALSSIYFFGSAPNTVMDGAFYEVGTIPIGTIPKAFIRPGDTSFTLDESGKWNGLTVEIDEPAVVTPTSKSTSLANSLKFQTSSTFLTPSQKSILKKMVAKSGKKATFTITGAAGKLPGVTDSKVKALAKKRAQIVQAYLVKLGVSKSKITILIKITNQGIVPKTKILAKYLKGS
jgi:hypothetical protein